MFVYDEEWLNQPQEIVRLRSELKPFSALIPSVSGVDLVNGTSWTPFPLVTADYGERAIDLPVAAARTWHNNSDLVIPSGSTATIVAVLSNIEYASTAGVIHTGASAGIGVDEFDIYTPYGGDDKIYFRWGGVTEGSTSLSFADSTGNGAYLRHVYLFSVGPAGMSMWRDGVKLASNSATPSRTASGVVLTIGARQIRIHLFATFASQFPEDLNRNVSLNPWLLVAPEQLIIPLAAASTGGLFQYDEEWGGAEGVSDDNPLAKGLKAALLPHLGLDAVLGRIGSPRGAAPVVVSPKWLGRTYTVDDQDLSIPAPPNFLPGACTIFALISYTSGYGNMLGQLDLGNNQNGTSFLITPGGGIFLLRGSTSTTYRYESGASFADGAVHALMVTHDGVATNPAVVTLDGVVLSGALTFNNAFSTSSSPIRLGTYCTGVTPNFRHFLALAWDRVLSANEQASVLAAANQVFESQVSYIPTAQVVAYYPGSDISVAGWTASTGTDLFACVDETTFDDADYITSPDSTTSAVMGWSSPVPAGTWSLAIRPMFPEGTSGQIRLVMLDSGSSSVGSSAWQALTGAFVTYTLAITTTGVSDRFRLEIQP